MRVAMTRRHPRRQLGRTRMRSRLHNFHLLYLFTERAGVEVPRPPSQDAASSLARPLHQGARPPVWRAVVRPARSFFSASLRRKVRHSAALRERAAVTGIRARGPRERPGGRSINRFRTALEEGPRDTMRAS